MLGGVITSAMLTGGQGSRASEEHPSHGPGRVAQQVRDDCDGHHHRSINYVILPCLQMEECDLRRLLLPALLPLPRLGKEVRQEAHVEGNRRGHVRVSS